MKEELILVDEFDRVVGSSEKLEAHRKGLLHRAFSIIIFNSKGEFLIQQRSSEKYHSKNLWSNTCCSHQIYGENEEEILKKRLKFEMGFECDLYFVHTFIYKVDLENNLIEHELDKIYIGEYDGEVNPNIKEVSAYRWVNLEKLRNEMNENPKSFTYWFKIIVNEQLEGFNLIRTSKNS